MERILIHPNHVEVVVNILTDPFNADHFIIYDLSDTEDLYDRIGRMTEKQYSYFKVLWIKNKWFDLKKLLDSFIKHK